MDGTLETHRDRHRAERFQWPLALAAAALLLLPRCPPFGNRRAGRPRCAALDARSRAGSRAESSAASEVTPGSRHDETQGRTGTGEAA